VQGFVWFDGSGAARRFERRSRAWNGEGSLHIVYRVYLRVSSASALCLIEQKDESITSVDAAREFNPHRSLVEVELLTEGSDGRTTKMLLALLDGACRYGSSSNCEIRISRSGDIARISNLPPRASTYRASVLM
jgi:hypothetical protein